MTPEKRRVLITGASGLLGANLVHCASTRWAITAITSAHPILSPPPGVVSIRADFLTEKLAQILSSHAPFDAIIHTAASTDVNRCEREPAFAKALNTDLAIAVARYASARGIHLVHISTDHIFDGRTGNYDVVSPPHPVNVYAATKLAAEDGVRAAGGVHTIVRTNFFGFNMQEKQDLAGWMCTQFVQHAPMRLFTDVRFSPILVQSLVVALMEIVERRMTGTLHVAAADGCSKYEFGMALARTFGYTTECVTPGSVDDAGFDVPRPKDMTLDTRAAQAVLSAPLPTVAESIAQYHALSVGGYAQMVRRMAHAPIRV